MKEPALQFRWTKTPPGKLTSKVGSLLLEIEPKGDGRFNWRVFKADTQNPMASGVASSLGAAKTVIQQFATRSGLV